MCEFIENLESRRLFNTVTLAIAEATLAADVATLGGSARVAKTDLVSAGKTFVVDLKALDLKTSPLKSKLQSSVNTARTKLTADVSQIITAGAPNAKAIFSDVLHITILDGGSPTKIARDQKKLAANITALQTIETPLVNKLSTDVNTQTTKVDNAVQAILTANSSDTALQTAWTDLSNVYETQENILVPDLNNVLTDLGNLSTAT
jgi:hypothetical protein